MADKKKKKNSSIKKPKQKIPLDTKIPKQKSPIDKIPKQSISDDLLLPPIKFKSTKHTQPPSQSRLRSDEIKKSNKGVPKEVITSKIPRSEEFLNSPK